MSLLLKIRKVDRFYFATNKKNTAHNDGVFLFDVSTYITPGKRVHILTFLPYNTGKIVANKKDTNIYCNNTGALTHHIGVYTYILSLVLLM